MEAYSNDGPTCWYAVDNLTTLNITVPDGPYGSSSVPAGKARSSTPAGAGTWYAYAANPVTGCDAGAPPQLIANPWFTNGFPSSTSGYPSALICVPSPPLLSLSHPSRVLRGAARSSIPGLPG